MDEVGQIKPVKDWPPRILVAVSAVKVMKRNMKAGDGVQEDVVEMKLWDKVAALTLLFRHLNLLGADKLNVTVGVDPEMQARLEAGRSSFFPSFLARASPAVTHHDWAQADPRVKDRSSELAMSGQATREQPEKSQERPGGQPLPL